MTGAEMDAYPNYMSVVLHTRNAASAATFTFLVTGGLAPRVQATRLAATPVA